MKKVLIFGGNGFLGSYLVRDLCLRNFQVVIASKSQRNIPELKTNGFPGQVAWKYCNVLSDTFPDDIDINYFDIIINLISLTNKRYADIYHKLHIEFPFKLASLCKKLNKKFIHVSDLLPQSTSDVLYQKTRFEGDEKVRKQYGKSIIIKSALIIGTNDHFVSSLEQIINILPVVPILANGTNDLRPIFAGDVSNFIAECTLQGDIEGKDFILFGKEKISLEAIVKKVANKMNKVRYFVRLPISLINIYIFIESLIPRFLFKGIKLKDIVRANQFNHFQNHNDLQLFIKIPTGIDKVLSLTLSKYKLYD